MLPLIPLALQVAPALAKWLFGKKADAVTTTVVNTVQAVTGAVDSNAVLTPQQTSDLRVALAKIVADQEAADRADDLDSLKAQLADVANARAQTVALAQSGSFMVWSAAVLSFVLLVAFGVMLYLVMTHAIPEGSRDLANIMLGTLGTMATQVPNYWLGSSSTDLVVKPAPAAK